MPAELATQDQGLDPATMELVIVNGDLSKLNAKQRIAWYQARCEAAGLDPRTEPFQYLNLQNKLKLYATKAATDQLIANRKLTVEITERRHDQHLGVYEVQCRVTFPDKHSVEDFAAIPVKGLIGEQLCNALMKACTKAKRRTVLSACGLGMLDETEVETVPNMEPVEFQAGTQDNQTGHGSGAYAPPETVEDYQKFIDATCTEINSKWLDEITSPTGEILSGQGEIITTWQLSGHLLKWAKFKEWVKTPQDIRAGQRDKFAAVAWADHVTEFDQEARAYCRGLWKAARKTAKAARPHGKRDTPELAELREQDEALDALETTEAGSRG